MFGLFSTKKNALVAEAKEWVNDGAILLDVRSQQEFDEGHLEGALLIPIAELEGRMSELEGKRVVVYCRSGMRSSKASRLMQNAGIESLDIGPMKAWRRAP